MEHIPPVHFDPISPIRSLPDTRHFVDAHGDPVFWLGDTQWDLFRLYTPDGAMRILEDRQAKGFNVILIMLIGINATRFREESDPPYTNLEGEQPWVDEDPLKPNEKYFEHVDGMIRLGEKTGQTFLVGVYHQWQVEIISVEKARGWARWVAERYRDVSNLIWSMYPKATEAFVPVCRELAVGLLEGDGGAHLISVHPDPAVASSSCMHEEPWLGFNMIQTCTRYHRIWEAVTADYARTPIKPVVMAEGGYEGIEFKKLQTPHDIRKQAYWSQLAGGHHVYGHNDSWAAPWDLEKWIDSPGSQHLKVFREVITSIDGWWTMTPDASILVEGSGREESPNVAARAAGGEWILVYLSEPTAVSIQLDALTGSGEAHAVWIDPITGDRAPGEQLSSRGVGSFVCPEGWEDALLLIEAVS